MAKRSFPNSSVLAVIPARGGSKRVKKKNLQIINGKSLLAYTSDAAKNSKYIQRIVLSSEDQEILDLGKSLHIETPFVRPTDLAADEAPTFPVIRHAVDWLSRMERYMPEFVVTLQPTSPLRTSSHIDESLERFMNSTADSLVSVVPVPHHYIPDNLYRSDNGFAKPYCVESALAHQIVQQEPPILFARNGPAILITRSSVLLSQNSLYSENIMLFPMRPEESVDIDTVYDLELAEHILLGRKRKS